MQDEFERLEKQNNILIRVIYTVLLAWILTAGITIFALLDGVINPVTTRLEITDIQPAADINGGDDWYRIIGTFDKVRDCQIVAVRWYYGERNDASRVTEVPVPTLIGTDPDYGSTPTSIPVGENTISTYLRVRLDPDLIESQSYAYVYHRCYGPWIWKTRTLFYDSRLAAQDTRDADS